MSDKSNHECILEGIARAKQKRILRLGRCSHCSLAKLVSIGTNTQQSQTENIPQIHKVQYGRPQMRNSGDTLHLDGVHLLERVVQDTGRIDGLETEVLVVEVADEERLRGESVGLDVDVGAGDGAQEARLADIRVTADEQGAGVGVDGGETAQVLADLVEVEQRVLQALGEGGHAAERGPLQLLALEQALGVLEQAHVVAGDGLDQVLCGGQLAQGDLEVVGIVEGVEQVLVEGVDVLQAREAVEDLGELLREGLLRELDLARVETPDTADLEARSDLGGKPSLRPAQDDVEELLRRRHRGDVFPSGLHYGDSIIRQEV